MMEMAMEFETEDLRRSPLILLSCVVSELIYGHLMGVIGSLNFIRLLRVVITPSVKSELTGR